MKFKRKPTIAMSAYRRRIFPSNIHQCNPSEARIDYRSDSFNSSSQPVNNLNQSQHQLDQLTNSVESFNINQTQRPVCIILANGNIVRAPNIQTLIASAQLLFQQQNNTTLKNSELSEQSNVQIPENLQILKEEINNLDDDGNSFCNSDNFTVPQYFNSELSPAIDLVDDSPTIASTLAARSNNKSEATVDGINLDEIKDFAYSFKVRRLALGLTQTQVGQALTASKGPAYSQSAICRFEKLDITPKSAAKIKPVLEKWIKEVEEKHVDKPLLLSRYKHANILDRLYSRKRKRRTSFTAHALDILNKCFEQNKHPSGTEMTTLAEKLGYNREVIRVWFCNKRQALKNHNKKNNSSSRSTTPSSLDHTNIQCSHKNSFFDGRQNDFLLNTKNNKDSMLEYLLSGGNKSDLSFADAVKQITDVPTTDTQSNCHSSIDFDNIMTSDFDTLSNWTRTHNNPFGMFFES